MDLCITDISHFRFVDIKLILTGFMELFRLEQASGTHWSSLLDQCGGSVQMFDLIRWL